MGREGVQNPEKNLRNYWMLPKAIKWSYVGTLPSRLKIWHSPEGSLINQATVQYQNKYLFTSFKVNMDLMLNDSDSAPNLDVEKKIANGVLADWIRWNVIRSVASADLKIVPILASVGLATSVCPISGRTSNQQTPPPTPRDETLPNARKHRCQILQK